MDPPLVPVCRTHIHKEQSSSVLLSHAPNETNSLIHLLCLYHFFEANFAPTVTFLCRRYTSANTAAAAQWNKFRHSGEMIAHHKA